MNKHEDDLTMKEQGFFEWAFDIERLKSIRTTLVIVAVSLIPILYFGYGESLSFDYFYTFDFGLLLGLTALSTLLVTKETKLRAFDNAYNLDAELEEKEAEYKENAEKIQALDKEMKLSPLFINKHNEEKQEMYNKIKTNNEISKIKRKLVSYRLEGKDSKVKRLENKIENLKKDPLFDKTFEPYDIKKIVNVQNGKDLMLKKKKKGDVELDSDPTKINGFFQVVSITIRSLSAGVAGSLPFALSESIGNIFRFYIAYFLILILTAVGNYLLTTKVTLGSYKKSLKSKLKLQELLLEHLKKEAGN